MTDFGLFSNRFSVNTDSLRKFDEAVRFFRANGSSAEAKTNSEKAQNLLQVLKPIRDSVNGKLSESLAIDDQGIVNILRNRHSSNWQSYCTRVTDLANRLEQEKFDLSQTDFQLLNDIADALDSHCANLFRRIRG